MSDLTTKLKALGEKWANLPDCKEANEIADEVMEELPEVIGQLKNIAMKDEWLAEWKRTAESLKASIPAANKLCRELEEAKKACAFYRDALLCIRYFNDDSPWDDPGACAADALQRCDCGSDYIHKDEVKPLVEALKDIRNTAICVDGNFVKSVRGDWLQNKCNKALAHTEKLMKGETK